MCIKSPYVIEVALKSHMDAKSFPLDAITDASGKGATLIHYTSRSSGSQS